MTTNSNTTLGPLVLQPAFSERIWGRRDLRPWYDREDLAQPIGEAWLTGPESRVANGLLAGRTLSEAVRDYPSELLGHAIAAEGSPEFPLLVKLLFPNDKLSVQVHPNDAEAQALGQPRGKTECWYVLEAKPGAEVALGLKDGVDRAAVERAVAAGTMEDLLRMLPVSTGDMVFVDAGTVHAIGPGVVLLETQQTSDITYRMYDYGRPRELHLEQGLAVMRTGTRAGKVEPRQMDGSTRLIEEQYFCVDRFDLAAGATAQFATDGPACVAGIVGESILSAGGEETVPVVVGQAIVLPVGAEVSVTAGEFAAAFVRCSAPGTP